MDRITSSYEHALQVAYYHIGNRGICVDTDAIEDSKAIVRAEISRQLAVASAQWGCKVFIGRANAPEEVEGSFSGAVNLNATQGKYRLLDKLKQLGYTVPKVTKKNDEGEYESKESTDELVLRKVLQNNQFNYPGGDPAIKAILKVRELGKLTSTYLSARLYRRGGQYFFLCNYNVAGTVTGRRSSRRHTFGFGNNAQNFPKHSDVASLARRCFISRPGNVLLMCDQVSAEDWPVCALSENHSALAELKAGTVDRHTKLASFLFNIPLNAKTPQEWKDSIERYLGKKTRHASNYDERAGMMSESLIREGFFTPVSKCQYLLDRMGQIDPNIKGIFHKWVQDTVSRTHMLITPFGRERQFLSARPNDYNSTVFKEAYAYVPQSVVGDNTGFAVLQLETKYSSEERFIVQEGHDSIVQDIRDDTETVYKTLLRTIAAFDRRIKFHNGIEIQIPIEAEVAYNFNSTVKIKDFSRAGVAQVLEKLKDIRTSEESKKITLATA